MVVSQWCTTFIHCWTIYCDKVVYNNNNNGKLSKDSVVFAVRPRHKHMVAE